MEGNLLSIFFIEKSWVDENVEKIFSVMDHVFHF